MSPNALFQCVVYLALLVVLGAPLGAYMARVYEGKATWAQKVLGPLERLLYRMFGVRPETEQSWQRYAVALLLFNVLGVVLVYVLQRLQGVL
ncbi:MAG TPA: potassium-transporting ATPase subunit KdpA, partial [Candidatus Krumholzibacteria bacterium]|nr:potassium-transporting ATPase subunit KdpA [Candidatus Krumholzibacteria bacterium]